MNSHDASSAARGVWGWWTSPPRSGLRLIICPWEYRHLRGWARVHLGSGVVLACLGVVTLAFGGSDWKTYRWTIGFLAAAGASLAFAYWELGIARSRAGEPEPVPK